MDVDLELDPIAQAVAKAQEQLNMEMEAHNKEKRQQLWVEEDQKSQRTESSMVVVLDKEAAVEAMEKVVREIGLWYCQVSFLLDFIGIVWKLT